MQKYQPVNYSDDGTEFGPVFDDEPTAATWIAATLAADAANDTGSYGFGWQVEQVAAYPAGTTFELAPAGRFFINFYSDGDQNVSVTDEIGSVRWVVTPAGEQLTPTVESVRYAPAARGPVGLVITVVRMEIEWTGGRASELPDAVIAEHRERGLRELAGGGYSRVIRTGVLHRP